MITVIDHEFPYKIHCGLYSDLRYAKINVMFESFDKTRGYESGDTCSNST